ncbi:MAG: metallophosphoesterase family protein [Candidatus Dormibacteria bacterium]
MTMRILHLADLHLDRAFAGMGCHGDLAVRRRLGLREALRRAGETAAAAGCDVVTIGGDLYEHDRAGADTAALLQHTFAAWQPMRVLIAPGNHDPLLRGSLYTRTEWPDNVHVFTGQELEPLALDDGLTVWGLAHHEPVWMGDPLAGDPVGADGGVHLALFHGAEVSWRPDGKSLHGPFQARRIAERGFAAALCGHYHRRRVDTVTGLLYPGSPEPLTFDETEARGPVLVTVGGNGAVDVAPIDDNRWHARSASCAIDGVGSTTAALEMAAEAARPACAGTDPERTMLRLDLLGEVGDGVVIDAFTVDSHLRERLGLAVVRVRDLTQPHLALDATNPSTVRSAFIAAATAAREAADGAGRAVFDDALRYGLQALSGAEVGLR